MSRVDENHVNDAPKQNTSNLSGIRKKKKPSTRSALTQLVTLARGTRTQPFRKAKTSNVHLVTADPGSLSEFVVDETVEPEDIDNIAPFHAFRVAVYKVKSDPNSVLTRPCVVCKAMGLGDKSHSFASCLVMANNDFVQGAFIKLCSLVLRSQRDATPTKVHLIYEDNMSAINMVNNSIPTERSRHIDIQKFAIQGWKDRALVTLSHISGVINPADALTKPLGWILHHRHVRRLHGHYCPSFVPHPQPPLASSTKQGRVLDFHAVHPDDPST
mmetsp:Transcript_9758/g.23903  ORF Transcript_9758/g.23903 Transcript_9758/m.23903 type:complete len:272 (+) Transcript_9758:335-1150(+)